MICLLLDALCNRLWNCDYCLFRPSVRNSESQKFRRGRSLTENPAAPRNPAVPTGSLTIKIPQLLKFSSRLPPRCWVIENVFAVLR